MCQQLSSGTRDWAPLPEGAARAVQEGALGERKGQAVLEPAHVNGWGSLDKAHHGHQLSSPAYQGPCVTSLLLDGGRNWGGRLKVMGDLEARHPALTFCH